MSKAMICEMKSVESSQIVRVGYTAATETSGYLFIDFDTNGRSLYLYHPVSKEMYEGLMNAESKGHYFSVNIKNNPLVSCIKIP